MKRVTAICVLTVSITLLLLATLFTPENMKGLSLEEKMASFLGEFMLIFLGFWVIEKIVLYVKEKVK